MAKMMGKRNSKVLVIGVDGASFNFIDPLVSLGRMPHVAKLLERGRQYTLNSTVPANTPVAWTSMVTGKNPGKHGIFGFVDYNLSRVLSSLDNKSKCIWDLLSLQGKSSIIINIPFTWPPRSMRGVLATFDWTPIGSASKKYRLAWPLFIDQYIKKRGFDKIAIFHPERIAVPNIARYEEIVKMETEFAVAMSRVINWDLLFVVFMVTDNVLHIYPSQEDLIKKVYRIIDEAIGQLLQLVDLDNDYVFVVSDHGTRVYRRAYSIPAFFRKQRLVNLRPDLKNQMLSTVGTTFSQHFIKGLHKPFYTISKLYKKVAGRDISLDFINILDKETSLLYIWDEKTHIDVLININKGLPKNSIFKRKLCRFILSEINKEEEVVKSISTSQNLYSGPYASRGPDIALEMVNDVAAITRPSSYYERPQIRPSLIGGHTRKGILIACGGNISHNDCRGNARIYDLAPTILHILQVPIPIDVDGTILYGFYNKDNILSSTSSCLNEDL